ncbi:expressed unknown protein [Seminavis robusta]|uniref:Uncharacterized protein n=1 Tax=Seminavis robusta TaxID=568900 RepID=A0A9N8DLT6_9STRA|nr:expressed unknown protein [Seminavis robusta]|eukprot:Sro230_g093440.1 n/a (109) ;mRNA; r:73129-73455
MKSTLFLLLLPALSWGFLMPSPAMQRTTIKVFETSENNPTERTTTKASSSAEETVAKQIKETLESTNPADLFEEKNEEEEEEGESWEYQIFNPNMFWTERSGRFPTTH